MDDLSAATPPMCRPLWRRGIARAFVAAMLALPAVPPVAQDRFIVMASTTSTEQSGLFAHLLPAFKRAVGGETLFFPNARP